MNPYDVVDAIEVLIREGTVSLVNNGKTSFSIKCALSLQASRIQSLVHVGNISCKTTLHPRFNTSKGLIFLSEFDLNNLQQFQKELPGKYNIAEIERATFIKSDQKVQRHSLSMHL